MIRYVVYHEDGRTQKLECEKQISLQLMQRIIGGYVEAVRGLELSADGIQKMVALVDEDGINKNIKPNPIMPCFRGTIILTTEEGAL